MECTHVRYMLSKMFGSEVFPYDAMAFSHSAVAHKSETLGKRKMDVISRGDETLCAAGLTTERCYSLLSASIVCG